MKGTFIQSGIQYTLDVKGESWKQGERIMGSLNIESQESLDLSNTGVFLAYVNSKKFKAKDDKAFKILDEVLCEENSTRFQFQLSKNCPITESLGSLYVLCGPKDQFYEGGHLELQVTPHKIITEFMQILEFQYRFKFKPLKNKKDYIEGTIVVPDSKKYTSVQQFKLHMKMTNEILQLKFQFKLKKVDFSSRAMGTTNENLEVTREISPDDYLIYGDSINQDGICKHMDEVLEQIKVKSII